MATARSRPAIKRLVKVALVAAVAAFSGIYVADLSRGGSDPAEEDTSSSSTSSASSSSNINNLPPFLATNAGFPFIQCYLAPDGVRAEHPIKEDFQATWWGGCTS
jgi:hypothetical protein